MTNLKYADWLRKKRLGSNYSQQFVADYLKVSRETVSGWENGRSRPGLESLQKIFEMYQCSNDEIVDFINLSRKI
ncbi:helix-turn-helix transcriptional regulator [Paraliobacillus ryukyuensis]|uniref:helix-turn-helix transcriptional regulator n=1 Tax=Paraliobacillus ryukyuensis TaxID=200904 RepID=UPI001C4E14AC|nr:helix-turn-helix transcriptional regulator [Paraliobacillus ryukyuensis]